MNDKDKSLVVTNKKIFDKFIIFLKKVFNFSKNNKNYIIEKEDYNEKITDFKYQKQELKHNRKDQKGNVFLKYDVTKILENDEYKNEFVKYDFPQDLEYEKEKIRILSLYNNIKIGAKRIEDIEAIDLVKINQLLKEEINFKNIMDSTKKS